MNSILVFSLFALISIGTLATASAQYSTPICGFGFSYDSKSARELIRCFQENPNLLEVEPNMAYSIGSAYEQLGDNQKAIKYFEFDLNYDNELDAILMEDTEKKLLSRLGIKNPYQFKDR